MTSQSAGNQPESTPQDRKDKQTSAGQNATSSNGNGNAKLAHIPDSTWRRESAKLADRINNAPKSPSNIFSKFLKGRKDKKNEKKRIAADKRDKQRKIEQEQSKFRPWLPYGCVDSQAGVKMENGRRKPR